MKSRIMTTFILLVLAVFPSCNKNTENFPIIPFGVSADYNGSRRINSESVYAQLQTGSMGSFVYFEAYDSVFALILLLILSEVLLLYTFKQ